MKTVKTLSISLLREILFTQQNTLSFAESKIKYLDSSISIRHAADFLEFMETKHRCEVKINQIKACITWLKTLEND
jgi:hypothetical protein